MSESVTSKKCFTFTWTIENISYYWLNTDEFLRSPTFVINALQEWKYFLALTPNALVGDDDISFRLQVEGNQSFSEIDGELALLSKDGSVLTSQKFENDKRSVGFMAFGERKVFLLNRSAYLPEDTLTARCRIWKRSGNMVEDIQCFARTQIVIEKEAFLWDIQNFSRFQSEEISTYQIKSALDDEVWMTLNLFLKNLFSDCGSINIHLTSKNGKIKYCVLRLILLNGVRIINQEIRKEFLFSNNKSKLFTVYFSKYDLMGNKHICLQNDVLSFRCECTFSTGKTLEKIERVVYDCGNSLTSEADKNFLKEENLLSVSKLTSNENLKSLFHDNILPDVNLKTSSKIFPAHKNILSVRSPVFKAMFSNDMEGKFNECIDIEDLNSDTVFRLLLYIYTAEIQDLQWEKACELHRAAAKYKILTLRDECSAYIKSNLCLDNACDVLILADVHQDEDLKASTQNFIFDHDVINSEVWKQLMKTHVKLAADTMYLQIQRNTLRGFKMPSPTGTNFKFNAPIETIKFHPPIGTDTTRKGNVYISIGTRHQCITIMQEYENESLEELRFDYYTANREECSTTGGKKFGALTLQTNVFSTSTTSTSDFLFSEKQFDNFFHTTSTKEFSAEFGMNSKRPPSAYPWFEGTLAKTATATSELSSNSIHLDKGFNFKATENSSTSSFSFGSSDQKTSLENTNEKESFKALFSFDNSQENVPVNAPSLLDSTSILSKSNSKEPVNKAFSFVSNNKEVLIKPSFSNGNNNEEEYLKPFFSFGCAVEKKPVKPLFSFSSNKKKKAVKPSFSFASTSGKGPFNAFSSLGSINHKETSSIPFSFAKSGERGLVQAFSSIGNSNNKEPSNISFSFGFCVKPSFLNENQPELSKPSFSFASSDEKESIKPRFSLGNSREKEPTELFSTSSSNEVEPVKQSFLLSYNKEKEPIEATVSSVCCDCEDSREKDLTQESFANSSSNEDD